MNIRNIKKLVRVSLIMVYLVVIAGSVVRMTGSGMGCPDWPKCFGYLIPPTEHSQLEWKPEHEYFKGQIIIVDEALVVANRDFKSTAIYNTENWAAYTKHDYAIFNPFHTWTEYINRLIGALTGIPVLLLFLLSFTLIRRSWAYPLLGIATLFMLGFEAWLGKVVVDGNLIPNQITIHMLGAMILVVLLVTYLARLKNIDSSKVEVSKWLSRLLLLTGVLLFFQIILGTQVREEVDAIAKITGEAGRSGWIDQLPVIFKIHRSYAISLVVLALAIFWMNRKLIQSILEVDLFVVLVLLEAVSGIILTYAGMPKAMQPMHLLFSLVSFGLVFYVILRSKVSRATPVFR
jgi:cytochrome c oxidase assembly protein subunit 15